MIATSGCLAALKCTKFVFGRGPDPAGGAHDAPPDPPSRLGRGTPLPIPHPLDAFGVSFSAPRCVDKGGFKRGWGGHGPQDAKSCKTIVITVLYVIVCIHA